MHDEGQALLRVPLAQLDDAVERVDGALLGGADDGDDGVDGLLLVEAGLEKGVELGDDDAGVAVDGDVDAVVGADANEGC